MGSMIVLLAFASITSSSSPSQAHYRVLVILGVSCQLHTRLARVVALGHVESKSHPATTERCGIVWFDRRVNTVT